MDRIGKCFKELRRQKKMAFMPFVVAGDPDYKTSLKIVRELVKNADFLELGFPYSDPLADGPVIQRADMRALASGMNSDRVFRLISKIRVFSDIPITVLAYANLVYRRGVDKFYRDAGRAGIDAVLVPDLPVEESDKFVKAAKKYGIDSIFLLAQTTTKARMKKILKQASGYLYLVSILGVTGIRKDIAPETLGLIRQLKKLSKLPVVVGFGVSNARQIKILRKAKADGVIVGSAILKVIEKYKRNPSRAIKEFIKGLN